MNIWKDKGRVAFPATVVVSIVMRMMVGMGMLVSNLGQGKPHVVVHSPNPCQQSGGGDKGKSVGALDQGWQ